MCTVTYIPKGRDQFFLTSNRDENLSRAAKVPDIQLTENQHTLFPKDPKSGGSWIAVSEQNKLACILNGAFDKHLHRPPYARSRGLVLLDFFKYAQIRHFIDQYRFEGIEPFTMILYEYLNLVELRWDGQKKHVTTLDQDQPQIWSSATLYDTEVRNQRARWFQKWLKIYDQPTNEDLLQFHRYGGEEDLVNGYVMNRNGLVQTLSITSIEKKPKAAVMHHQDLLNDQIVSKQISLENETVAPR